LLTWCLVHTHRRSALLVVLAASAIGCDGPSNTLRVEWTGEGVAHVTSEPPGLDCNEPCDARLPTGTSVTLHAELAYRRGRAQRTQDAETDVAVAPVLDIVPGSAGVALAPGAARPVEVRLVNHVDHPLAVTLSAAAPDGATADPAQQQVTLPASGEAEATITVGDAGRSTGTGTLQLTAATEQGAAAHAELAVRFSDDLARNGVGAAWPAAFAGSSQDGYPASAAFDGDAATFWVSAGTTAGAGPSPENPKILGVDLGAPTRIGSITMTPRTGYGPKAYTVEISDDGQTWTQIADEPAAANGPVTTTFDAVTTRWLRIRITDSWDRVRPPRNVQVVALSVWAPGG
jgi:hypothetical protein